MREQFVFPQEPRLDWSLVLSLFRRRDCSLLYAGKTIDYLFLARNAIYHGLRALALRAGESVLVPAYHCKALVEPILQNDNRVKFYDINRDLTPNFADIENRIDAGTRAIVLIHYFGFPQPIRPFRQICERHNLFLIEDCAHVLTGRALDGTSLGQAGDISVFSWRKFLPISDGGQLSINNSAISYVSHLVEGDFLFRARMTKQMVDGWLESSRIGQRVAAALESTLAGVRKWTRMDGDAANGHTVNSYDLEFHSSSVNLAMTRLSKRILRYTDVAQVMRKRRENYHALIEAIRGIPILAPLYPSLPAGVCPLICPVLVQDDIDLQPALRCRGIPVTSWAGVIHKGIRLEEYASARTLYNNLLFFPIHQSLTKADLGTMAALLCNCVANLRMNASRGVALLRS